MHSRLSRFNVTQLRRYLGIFFLALLIPSGLLIWQALDQLKWQSYHRYRTLAEELSNRIDERFQTLIRKEEARSFADYAFLVVSGDPSANFLQRSSLSSFPPDVNFPGLIGYFQIDNDGRLNSPVLPEPEASASRYGISAAEVDQRRNLQTRIQQILYDNHLVNDPESGQMVRAAKPESHAERLTEDEEALEAGTSITTSRSMAAPKNDNNTPARTVGQSLFDQLQTPGSVAVEQKKKAGKPGRLSELDLDYSFKAGRAAKRKKTVRKDLAKTPAYRSKRKERSNIPVLATPHSFELKKSEQDPLSELRIRTFESEIDPFEFSQLNSGHLVLFRKVWRNGQRFIQGALIEQQPFLAGLTRTEFETTTLFALSKLFIAYRDEVLSVFQPTRATESGKQATAIDSLLYQTRLSAPFNDLQLMLTLTRLPAASGSALVIWAAAILLIVLCAGSVLIYRLGAQQIHLARQQQDFVSAVSHELKTPLTSIRMYGEMLREGWTPEDRKKVYYDYIYDESERLSRLINNVLQLARMTRTDLRLELESVTASDAMDTVHSHISSLCERAGFELRISYTAPAASSPIQFDRDSWTQIVINLIDNAVKFSAKSDCRKIEFAARLHGKDSVQFSVRDYGPGIAPGQMRKIFRLFYRSENELTRETIGTGIGLALVHQLVTAMNGRVDAVNTNPGVEFRIVFPITGETTLE